MVENETPDLNHYRVIATGHPTRIIQEQTLEAAAVSYLEDFAASPPVSELKLWVTDINDGSQHCFLFDIDSGDLEICD